MNNVTNSTSEFSSNGGFCSECGSILPDLRFMGDLKCYTCDRSYPPQVLLATHSSHYTIHFNSRSTDLSRKSGNQDNDDGGPTVERKCPKCGNDKMSYAAIQLRSADEGQTVFYTCTKCKFKESENS